MLLISLLWLNPIYPKKYLKVYFQISPKWHGLSQTSGSSYTHSKDVLMHVDLFLKNKIKFFCISQPLFKFPISLSKNGALKNHLFSIFQWHGLTNKLLLNHVNVFLIWKVLFPYSPCHAENCFPMRPLFPSENRQNLV